MLLVYSVFITQNRSFVKNTNRYNRVDIMKYTLQSYTKFISLIDEAFFFIKLDEEFENRYDEIKIYIHKLFSTIKYTFIPDRWDSQDDWKRFIMSLYNINNNNTPVFFTQNDDHVFIDYDLDILKEGLNLLQKDINQYKSIYLSHWPEIIKLSCKFDSKLIPASKYVNLKSFLCDSIQIFNLGFLKYICVDLDWKNHKHKRIDSIAYHSYVWDLPHQEIDPIIINENIQSIYVPLRELCRHFDGYNNVGIYEDCPPLELLDKKHEEKKEQNIKSKYHLLRKFLAPHNSAWTIRNKKEIPNTFITTMLEAHEDII